MNDTTFQGNGKIAYVPAVVNAKQPKPTNYDSIRAKSVEEMAIFLANLALCSECNARREDCGINCGEAWLDWLKEEASE